MRDVGGLYVHGICNQELLYREVLSLDQTIRNLTCSDVKISFVLIRLGVTALKKTGFMFLLDLLVRSGKKG